ncbi:hypothetical protein [Kineosporia mesophila]|nr:hypothetical protein [Kineosporia mesophila]MCD5353233.1 hypothetical protein [Kineosporia mesophila]
MALPTEKALNDADEEVYSKAVRWVFENTRDHAKFPVVWSELKTYGHERNLLGLRPIGVALASLAMIPLSLGLLLGSDLQLLPSCLLFAACIGSGVW